MGVRLQSLAGQGQALCSLLPLPRGPCDNPLSGIFHAETVAQRGPWERCESRHHPSLPPGTGLPLLGGVGATLTQSHLPSEWGMASLSRATHLPPGASWSVRVLEPGADGECCLGQRHLQTVAVPSPATCLPARGEPRGSHACQVLGLAPKG